MSEWQQRLDALQVLVTAPFVIFIFVMLTVTMLVMTIIERNHHDHR